MTDPKAYHSDEQDLKLARLLDQSMDQAGSTRDTDAPGQDPLLPFLAAYKSAVQLKEEAPADNDLWLAVEKAIEDKEADRSAAPGLRPWRHEQPVSREDGPAPEMKVRWLPLLVRVAALFMLVVFMWMLLTRQDMPEPQLVLQTTSEKQQATLPDGTLVTLRPYSELFRLTGHDTGQRYKITGEGYFDIASLPHRSFVVMTDDAMVRVTGTRFSVSTWDRHTRVYLEKGAVLMALPDGSSAAALSPGETGRVHNGSIATMTDIPTGTHLGWLEDELVLDRRSLSSIIREIGHHFNVSISVSPDLVDAELSGTVVLDDAEAVIRDLAVSIGASVEQPEPGYFIVASSGENRRH